MERAYLRRCYLEGELIKYEIFNLPCDVGRWMQSAKLDRRDGFITSYKSIPSSNGKTRIVVSSKAYSKSSGFVYYFDLLSTDKAQKLYKKLLKENPECKSGKCDY